MSSAKDNSKFIPNDSSKGDSSEEGAPSSHTQQATAHLLSIVGAMVFLDDQRRYD